VYFYNVGSSRLSGSAWNRGVGFHNGDYYNGVLLDGVSVQGYNNSDANGLTFYYTSGVCRNGFLGNSRDYRPYYAQSRGGLSTFNMKISNVYRFRPEDPQNKVTNYNEVAGCYNIQMYPASNAAWYNNTEDGIGRRNSFHGIYNISQFWSGASMISDSMDPYFTYEYNRIYATNYNALNLGPGPEVSLPLGWDIHQEHPGMRLTQYRNEGALNWYNVPADLSFATASIRDYCRTGWDVSSQSDYNYIIRNSATDYIRLYSITNDGNLHHAAFVYLCKKPVVTQAYVEFHYRMPYRMQRLQNANGNYGKLTLSVIQNGLNIPGYPIYLPLPTDDGWVKYSLNINTIPTVAGKVAITLSRNAMSTFVDYRFGRAYVKTNDTSNVFTLANTFDTTKYFNLGNNKKHIVPLTTSPNIFKGVKF
jgi:hypothetical protein